MKKIFILLFISSLFLAGCDSYLDRQPDDQLTSETIWMKQNTTLQYLWNVYGYMIGDVGNLSNHWVEAQQSDEAAGSFPGAFSDLYIHETFNPGNGISGTLYTNPYVGIHEASVFIENVHKCPELSEAEVAQYKAEARFMRAYYYFLVMEQYGPTFFNGYTSYECLEDNIYEVDRAPWQTLVNFVCSELDEAYKDLPQEYELTKEYGRATKGAALAVKARLLLYNARPLFNGQNGTGIYDHMVNIHGEKLFNTTYDEQRWKDAAAAAKAVIDYDNGFYSLVDNSTNPDPVQRGLENFTELFVTDHAPSEYIWTYQKSGTGWRRMIQPQKIVEGVDGWASLSPTYKCVDAYAMASGVYPIKTAHWESSDYALGKNVDINNLSHVDPRAVTEGYAESGSVSMKHPLLECAAIKSEKFPVLEKPTHKRLAGREARFYRNIGWSGMQWINGDATVLTDVEFYTGGNSGEPNANNVPPCGFVALKLYDPTLNPKTTGYGAFSWPLFRLAAVYLDYIEALNEYDPSHADILKYWNKIRHRAGVPDIETIYPEIVGDKELQRSYIRRERMVELCFENYRLNDCRTWMIAEETNSGYTIGCYSKVGKDDPDSDYWQRVEIGMDQYAYGEHKVLGPRKFTKKKYLMPFPTSELNRVPPLRNSQNPGW